MSGTRSHSRKAPAINTGHPKALIVSHGQPSDPFPAEAALAALTARIQACLPDTRIGSATMANPGALESALELLPSNAALYPLFMSDGWFVKTALPKRIANRDLRVLPPLGLDTRLPQIAAQEALRAVERNNWSIGDTQLLIAAHGSTQGKAAARSARLFSDRLAKILPSAGITIGFVEEAPFLNKAAADLGNTALCMPFFAMEGEHVRDDIPEALDEAGFRGVVLPPFGQYNGIAKLIAETLSVELAEGKAA